MDEVTFTTLRDNFDAICNQVNDDKEAVTLTLKSGRKVFLMPEENYNSIERIFITKMTVNSITSRP